MYLQPWIYSSFTLIFIVLSARAQSLKRAKRTLIGAYPLCPRGCASCSSFNGCVTCKPKYYLLLERDGLRQTGSCVQQCPTSHYGVIRGNFARCYRCTMDNCEACFSSSHCTRCREPFLAYKGDCVDTCPEGLNYAKYTKDCLKTVDCVISGWSEWSQCLRNGQNCGYKYGLQSRSRSILQLPSKTGITCPHTAESTRCRMLYRSCVDLEGNSSDLIPTPDKATDKHSKSHRERNKSKKKKKLKQNNLKRTQSANRRNKKRRRMHRNRNKSKRKESLFSEVFSNKVNSLKLWD